MVGGGEHERRDTERVHFLHLSQVCWRLFTSFLAGCFGAGAQRAVGREGGDRPLVWEEPAGKEEEEDVEKAFLKGN
jgi:hypothetical protein